MEPQLNITWHVTAYDESYGGYGDNASRDFKDGNEAVAYANRLRQHCLDFPASPRYEPIIVTKRITMEPMSINVEF